MKDFMSMSEPIQKAFLLAKEKHEGVKDKAGKDYIYHSMTVASNVGDDETAIIVGLLHDVVEDTETSFEDLANLGFAPEVIDALKLVTRNKKAFPDYLDYVRHIRDSHNQAAIKVKIADLTTNMDLSRFPDGPAEKDVKRVNEKYIPAMKIIKGEME